MSAGCRYAHGNLVNWPTFPDFRLCGKDDASFRVNEMLNFGNNFFLKAHEDFSAPACNSCWTIFEPTALLTTHQIVLRLSRRLRPFGILN